MQELSSHLTDFHEIWDKSICWKFVEKIQVSLKSDKSNGYFTWRPIYIYGSVSLNSPQNEDVSEKGSGENRTKHLFYV
jgi:hypothetical protein